MTDHRVRQMIDEASKKLTDEGKLIEVGFYGYRKFVLAHDAPKIQIDECRMAFFAGAQHLFGSIMSIMDQDREPTANDLRRMDMINTELAAFAKEIELRIETKGKALTLADDMLAASGHPVNDIGEQQGHSLGDAPIEEEYRRKMNVVAMTLDEFFNGGAKGAARKTGFVLLVFPFNETGVTAGARCNFISNGADRREIVTLFKEMIARFEGQPEVSGRA